MSAATPPLRPRPSGPSDLGFQPQRSVRWLDPPQLMDTAWRAAVSTIFGSYSDKREVEARLSKALIDDRTAEDEIWIDYAADLGDGFSPTHTVAQALAAAALELQSPTGEVHATERGRILVLGGDEVYPTAKITEYVNRFVGPFTAALPTTSKPYPTMLAIPGNHDWYDGLTSFLRLFCQGRWIGGWRTEQTRSYFAVRLPHRWWLWGIDIQLNNSIDQAQLTFFQDTVVRKVAPGDSIILCSAVPGWMHAGRGPKQATFRNLQYFEQEVIQPTGARVMVYLSGDDHHYVRYEEEIQNQAGGDGPPGSVGSTDDLGQPVAAGQPDGNGKTSQAGSNGETSPRKASATAARPAPPRQRITCGTGGAYLYPTHHLEPALELNEHGTPARYVRRADYPGRAVSRRYVWTRIWGVPFLNRGFVVLVGGLYMALAWLMATGIPPGHGLTVMASRVRGFDWAVGLAGSTTGVSLVFVLACGLIAFADTRRSATRWGLGLTHVAAHVMAVGGVTLLASLLVRSVGAGGPAGAGMFLGASLAAGGLAGSAVMALYLWACNLAGLHSNEAYGAMRIADYKGFLRMHLGSDGVLTIYPVGIDRVARRFRLAPDGPDEAPWFTLQGNSKPHLIEEPVTVFPASPAGAEAPRGAGVRQIVLPDALPVQTPEPAEGALR